MDFEPAAYNVSDFAFADSFQMQSPDALIAPLGAHSSHPNFGHLCLLVFEAVMEVVAVSLPGYIVARMGMFDGNAQKFVANLNMTLFTPCLIFSKLARQLTGDKLGDLVIIPIILLVQTVVSWISAKIVARLFRLKKKPQNNFVTAMAVFGNSNSLPLSLVISLSHTISGLHWAKVPGDNDDEVAARGILYLLIFSQLGQALRWSWGMNSLLRPLDTYTPAERGEILYSDEEGFVPYTDDDDEAESSTRSTASDLSDGTVNKSPTDTPVHPRTEYSHQLRERCSHTAGNDVDHDQVDGTPLQSTSRSQPKSLQHSVELYFASLGSALSSTLGKMFRALPGPLRTVLTKAGRAVSLVSAKIWACLNVPLAAIIVSILVSVIPPLKAFFFTEGTFVRNSITRAVEQSGGVAVPLILVVLGANLARNTLPDEGKQTPEMKREERNMLIASLLCRMVLPTIIMAPILAVMAKFVPISIFDDPIFLIVCFLLTGAPSALQLAQMCQVNGVFIGTVSRLLFHSYVVLILPSTLILVMLALEVVEWVDSGSK